MAARDAFLPEPERADPRRAFVDRVLSAEPEIYGPAATVLSASEMQTLDLFPAMASDDPLMINVESVLSTRLYAHYDLHDLFLRPDQLIAEAGVLAEIPGAIVAGRADLCTPPKGAFDLAQAWPKARLRIVAAAGHRWSDELLGQVLVPEIARVVQEGAGRAGVAG